MGGVKGRDAAARLLARGGRRDSGYILLDVLVTLLIVLVGFTVFLSSTSIAARTTIRQSQKVYQIIERRNADAEARAVVFQAEK